MSTPYDSALAAIDFIGNDLVTDLSGNGGSVEQAANAVIPLTAATPTNMTMAAWYRYTEGNTASVFVLVSGIDYPGAFASQTMLYVPSSITAATTITVRRTSTVNFSCSSTDFSDWQHVLLTIAGTTGEVFLNGTSLGTQTVDTASYNAIAFDSGNSQRSGSIGAGIAIWDSVLSSSDITWLATPANRPQQSSGSSTTNPFKSRAFAG